MTSVGTTVITADNNSGPGTTTIQDCSSPREQLGRRVRDHHVATGESTERPVSIIISAADGAGYIDRNGVEIGRAPITGLRGIYGSHAFSALATVDLSGRRDWSSIANVGKRVPPQRARQTHMGRSDVPCECM
jgi:hypothetical protein